MMLKLISTVETQLAKWKDQVELNIEHISKQLEHCLNSNGPYFRKKKKKTEWCSFFYSKSVSAKNCVCLQNQKKKQKQMGKKFYHYYKDYE